MAAPHITSDQRALDFDRTHIYHPYTSFGDPLPVYPVIKAEGTRIHLADGRVVVDGMSSWWAAIFGYNHPRLNRVLNEQAQRFSHVMFGGFTHQPAIDLAARLLGITPTTLQQVFFCDSGSVAVEVAMKMALQYFIAQDQSQRSRFIALRGGYHGDTFQAMSVCDPVTGMHHLFSKTLTHQIFAPRPACPLHAPFDASSCQPLIKIFEERGHEVAALILEPIVQGAGGMYFYHPEYLRRARELCDAYGVLLIADEIATGFGRTGKMLACDHASVSPDILCLGKALTGGMMSLAATLCSQHVTDTIASGPAGGTFMHGPTFMANPLACAVANESLAMLAELDLEGQINAIAGQLERELTPLWTHSAVREVRVFGAIGVVEMKELVDVAAAQKLFVEHGAWIRPFGRLVYLMPPFTIAPDELSVLTSAIGAWLDKG